MANSIAIGVAYKDQEIVGGTIDNTAIGSTTAAAGSFTSVAASGAVAITGGATTITTSSASTNASTSVAPFKVTTTMTGAGGVGGRAHFTTNINAALGGWSNAIKGEVAYGSSGRTTGLGSAVLAEMTLSAGTTSGTYGVIEAELNVPSGAKTGTLTSFLHASVQGADVATFDTNGFVLNIQGLTAGSGKVLATGTTLASAKATLRCKVGATTYYIPLYDGQIT